nr:outer membrane protein transport protein [Oceaniglobus trochenteri]
MNKFMLAGLAGAMTAGVAHAGAVDRSGQSVAVIFEPGNYFEASFGSVSPKVSGVGTAFSPTPGGSSGNMTESYTQIGTAYKHDFGNGLAAALIFDQPFGADVNYPATQPYFARGSVAELSADALTAVVKYKFASNVSLYGGLRYQTFSADATIPFVTAGPGTPGVVNPGAVYTAKADKDEGFGYLLGVAYEKPEVALRVALTYNSKIKHSLATSETSAFGGPVNTTTEIETPQSVNLEFQTGVAKDTLVFGSVRWVNWSDFDITPVVYQGLTGNSLVSYAKDIYTLNLGVGRKLNENWSVAASVGYEEQQGGFSSNLGPTDGNVSFGLGATYTQDRIKVTGGIRYVDIGNAQTTLGGGVAASEFSSNHAVGFGLKVGYTF